MRFWEFITEDMEKIRDYKKAVFDLKVAIKELEFEEGEQVPPDDPDKKLMHQNKLVTLKLKIIRLKNKIMNTGKDLNDSVEIDRKELQELLDKIPDKGSEEEEKLKKEKERLAR